MAWGYPFLGSSMRTFHVWLQKAQKNQMTVPWVGFGMRWMSVPLHTGQRVGRRGVPEASPMCRSVGDAEAVRKFKRKKRRCPNRAPICLTKNGVGADGQHVPLGF
jgi:hypothetical protein